MAYTKLFNSIITSTIWTEDDRTRIVWITMLACADKNGEVQASIPGLARIAGVPVEDCRSAIQKFLSPDIDSRTKDDEGRRIEEIDGGWALLNHRKYRDMATAEDQRKQAAERQQRARDKKSRNSHAPVTRKSRRIAQADADTDANTDTEERQIPPVGGESVTPEQIYSVYPRRVAKPDALKAITKALGSPPAGFTADKWPGELLAIVERYAALRKSEPERFTPHPATWFNQQRFNDDPATWVDPPVTNGSSVKKRTPRDMFAS